MTQLDLPQVSIGRYLELMQRRKWQVIPISLLGLIVGAVVAFFVPRYYVAATEVHFRGKLAAARAFDEDPLAEELSSARVLIPAAVPDALDELGWPEAMVEDREERAAVWADVRSRVSIQDVGPSTRGRTYTDLKIVYKDTDGARAAELANKLRDVWLEGQRKKIRDMHQKELELVQRNLATNTTALFEIRKEIKLYQLQHGLDPATRRLDARPLDQELESLENQDAELVGDLAMLDSEIDALEQQVSEGDVPARIPKPPEQQDPIARQELLLAAQQLLAVKRVLLGISARNPHYDFYARRQRELEETIGALSTPAVEDTIPNPEYQRLQRQLSDKKNRRLGLSAQRQPLRARIAELREKLRALPGIWEELEAKRTREEGLLDERKALEARRQELTDGYARLDADQFEVLSEARVPPRPTEPSITLLALAGSLIGLGLAIGVILLLDAVRFTFKTLDDVEHALPVPLLGGLSHLETAEARRAARRTRLWVTTVSLGFLALVVAVVTIYYVAPARLPAPVIDLLDLLLGAPK